MPAVRKIPQDHRAKVNHLKAKVGALSRSRTDDDPELVEARLNLKAAHLASDVAAVVNSWPALTQSQLDRIAGIIRTAPVAPPSGGDPA